MFQMKVTDLSVYHVMYQFCFCDMGHFLGSVTKFGRSVK